MDKSLVLQLTGRDFPTAPARLKDFKKLISHLGYPYIVREKDSQVEGLLIKGLDAEAIRRLDQYEGRLYARAKVTVASAGREVSCEVYMGDSGRLSR